MAPKVRRRARGHDPDCDDEEPIGGWKLGVVIGVIVVCFAVIYPTVFHPLIMSFMGRADPAPQPVPHRPPMHPGMGASSRPGPPHRGAGDVHPAMRMAAAQAEQGANSNKGGARGIYTWMIPFYTVGVVVFLLYTLFKSKKKKRSRRSVDSSDEEEDEDPIRERKGRINRGKLRGLQERLRQTEDAMSKILEQLEKAQSEGKINLEAVLGDSNEQSEAREDKAKKSRVSEAPKEKRRPTTAQNGQTDPATSMYMEDLEQALAEFKELSDLYDEAKGAERRQRASESESETCSESASVSDSDAEVDPFEMGAEDRVEELEQDRVRVEELPDVEDDEVVDNKKVVEEKKEDDGKEKLTEKSPSESKKNVRRRKPRRT